MFRKSYKGKPARPLTEDDVSGWMAAADERPAPLAPKIADVIRKRNRFRWRRFIKDYRWVQKEMEKMGLSPEDARWLLP
jgi:hypothetical protein